MQSVVILKIGLQLKARRTFLRIRQSDLAEIAGVSLRGLKDIENGKGNPTLQTLLALGEALGMELAWVEPRQATAPSGFAIDTGVSTGAKLE